MIEQFYLIHRWDSTGTTQSGPESNGNEGILFIPETLELEPHHQMQFCHTQNTF